MSVLAFFGNLAPSEILVLAVIAVLIFGKRLPQVAGKAYMQLRRWRESLDHLRRETGIDHELRKIEHTVQDAARSARIEPPTTPPRATVSREPEPSAAPEEAESAENRPEPQAPGSAAESP